MEGAPFDTGDSDGEPLEARDFDSGSADEAADGYGDRDAITAGDADDDPIPEDFPCAETAEDLPDADRVEMAAVIEQFASGGERFDEMSVVTDETGTFEVHDSGFERAVPREHLDAEGVPYDVKVRTLEPSAAGPYTLGAVATRIVRAQMDLPTGPDGADERQEVDAEEAKSVWFGVEPSDAGTATLTMSAESSLVGPHSSSFDAIQKLEPGEPVPDLMFAVDHETPLLTLTETQAILRALRRATTE
jgi:hypothetical protein